MRKATPFRTVTVIGRVNGQPVTIEPKFLITLEALLSQLTSVEDDVSGLDTDADLAPVGVAFTAPDLSPVSTASSTSDVSPVAQSQPGHDLSPL